MLSNEDIKRAIRRKDIVIEPFDLQDPMTQESLTNVGFDVRVGDVVISLTSERGLLPTEVPPPGAKDFLEGFWIEPFETVLVLTREYIQVSNTIGGTFHTRVTLIARGFSSISTTLDPGWQGRLYITITNLRNHKIFLGKGEKLTTLVFYRVRRHATLVAPNQNDKLKAITNRLVTEARLSDSVREGILKLTTIAEQSKQDHIIQEKNDRERRKLEIRRTVGFLLLVMTVMGLSIALLFVSGNDSNSTNIRLTLLGFIIGILGVIGTLLYQRSQ